MINKIFLLAFFISSGTNIHALDLKSACVTKSFNLDNRTRPICNPPNSQHKWVYRSYETSTYCNPSEPIQFPIDSLEVQKVIRRAVREGKTVKALGSRHSATDIICTDGIPISMKNIKKAVVNDDGTVSFGAGIELFDAMEFLEKNGRSLIHIPSYGEITLGGAIATGALGSSLIHPTSISDQVVSLTVIDGLGEKRIIQGEDTLLMNAFRVHLGLLGIIIDITLQTVPLFKMKVENYVQPDSVLFDGSALKMARQHDWLQMWWFPGQDEVVLSKGNYTNVEMEGNCKTNLIPDLDPLVTSITSFGYEILQRCSFCRFLTSGLEVVAKRSLYTTSILHKQPIFIDSAKTLQNPASGFAWRLQSNKCTHCVWDHSSTPLLPEASSMAFDISKFTGVINMIKSVLRRNPTSLQLVGIFIRFSKASNALMAITNGRPSFTVEWVTPMRWNRYEDPKHGIQAYQYILQSMVTNYDGRPHWGKNGLYYFTQEILNKTAPNRRLFLKVRERFDPQGIFLNKFGHRILGLSDKLDVDPKVNRCALQDYCICKLDKDCGESQQCTNVTGFPICTDLTNQPVASFSYMYLLYLVGTTTVWKCLPNGQLRMILVVVFICCLL